MMSKTSELRTQFEALRSEIDELDALETPTEEQVARYEQAIDEAAEARSALEASEARDVKADEIRTAAMSPARVEKPRDAKSDPVLGVRVGDPFDMSGIRSQNLSPEDLTKELIARAREGIEQAPSYLASDEARQAATQKVDQDAGKAYRSDGFRDSNSLSEHVLKYGSTEYADNFMRWFRSGHMEERTAMALAGSNGGYLLPTLLDPTVILTNAGTVNPFRKIATVETITQNVKTYVSSDGVQSGFIAEASEVTDGSPTFSNPSITTYKGFAHAFASREIIEDADNLAGVIATMFQDGKDRIESDKFANGSGSGEPYGIVTALNLTTASRTAAQTNGSFGAIDVFNLVNNLPARYQDNNISFVAHWFVYNLARQFGGANQPNFWVEFGPGTPATMLGVPVYKSSQITNAAGALSLSSATASSDNLLILGDFSYFHVVDRIGMEIVYDPLVLGSNRRPTGQMSWTAFWRVGSDSLNDGAFQMLRV